MKKVYYHFLLLLLCGGLYAQPFSLLKDINGTTPSISSNPYDLTSVNGTVYFSAVSLAHGRELWKTDGTESGTLMIKDINPGLPNSFPTDFTKVGNLVYFIVNEGPSAGLWKTDGTEAGTVLVKLRAARYTLGEKDGILYFYAQDRALGSGLWKTDGTPEGTVLVKPLVFSPTNFITAGGVLFFVGSSKDPNPEGLSRFPSLWKTDGPKQVRWK